MVSTDGFGGSLGGPRSWGGLGGVWGGVPEGKTLPEGGLGGSGTRVSVGGGKMIKNHVGAEDGLRCAYSRFQMKVIIVKNYIYSNHHYKYYYLCITVSFVIYYLNTIKTTLFQPHSSSTQRNLLQIKQVGPNLNPMNINQ